MDSKPLSLGDGHLSPLVFDVLLGHYCVHHPELCPPRPTPLLEPVAFYPGFFLDVQGNFRKSESSFHSPWVSHALSPKRECLLTHALCMTFLIQFSPKHLVKILGKCEGFWRKKKTKTSTERECEAKGRDMV